MIKLDMKTVLTVGFGEVTIRRDGEVLYSEIGVKDDKYPTAEQAELMASEDPDHDWIINFYAPLWESEYKRFGVNDWRLTKTGLGFA